LYGSGAAASADSRSAAEVVGDDDFGDEQDRRRLQYPSLLIGFALSCVKE